MADTRRNYINGEWVESASRRTFADVNPANGEVLNYFPESDQEDIHRAVEAADAAFEMWRNVPAPKRAEILFRAGEILVRRKEELARQMTMEMGKVLKEARGDVQEAIDMTYYMAGEGRRLFGHTTPSELPDKLALAIRVPVGVVGAITPWNFPMAIPSWKIMPALVAGNTVVLKPSQFSPWSAHSLAKVMEEAGLPAGVLNVVFGAGANAGAWLVEEPGVKLVSFTGSTLVGSHVWARSASLGKRCHVEMGGKNAIMVMDDADTDLAVDGIIWSAFGTSGQRCTAASRIIVQRGIYEELLERVVSRAKTLHLGNGLDPATDVGPVVNEFQLRKVESYMEIGMEEGARIVCGGEAAREGELARGFFFKPTVFTNVHPNMRIAQEEIFGPVTAFIVVDSLEEAIRVNNSVPYGLVSSIYSRDVSKAMRAVEEVDTALIYVNAGTIGAEVHLPFGGTKATGNGHREAGWAALDVFTEWRTVFIDYSGRLQKAQQID